MKAHHIIGAGFVIVLLFVLWAFWKAENECGKRHGVLVKTAIGYECAQLVIK